MEPRNIVAFILSALIPPLRLSTAILLMFVAGGLMFSNFTIAQADVKGYGFGFPVPFAFAVTTNVRDYQELRTGALLFDFVLAVFFLWSFAWLIAIIWPNFLLTPKPGENSNHGQAR